MYRGLRPEEIIWTYFHSNLDLKSIINKSNNKIRKKQNMDAGI